MRELQAIIDRLPALLSSTPRAADLDAIERALIGLEDEGLRVDLAADTGHAFAEGQMARTLLIRAGTWLVGAEHRSEHLCICSGDLTVWTVGAVHRLTGHQVLRSLAGARRVGYAHADTHFTTVHLNPDNERRIEVLEDRYVVRADRLQHRRRQQEALT